jgi:hypothetical protein
MIRDLDGEGLHPLVAVDCGPGRGDLEGGGVARSLGPAAQVEVAVEEEAAAGLGAAEADVDDAGVRAFGGFEGEAEVDQGAFWVRRDVALGVGTGAGLTLMRLGRERRGPAPMVLAASMTTTARTATARIALA